MNLRQTEPPVHTIDRELAARVRTITASEPEPPTKTLASSTGKSKDVLASLDLLVSNERLLSGFFGSVRLMHGAKNVDLNRVHSGICNFCVDHDASAIIGLIEKPRIDGREFRAVGKVLDVPLARPKLREIQLGLRRGISPGFIVHAVEPCGLPDADKYDIDIVHWEPYECSTTAIPRNSDARITGGFSMDTSAYKGPPLLTTSDPARLHAEALRMALNDGQLSGARADTVRDLLGHYDKAVADGKSSTEAAQIAAQQVAKQ